MPRKQIRELVGPLPREIVGPTDLVGLFMVACECGKVHVGLTQGQTQFTYENCKDKEGSTNDSE